MPTDLSLERRLQTRSVCDLCHSRKVRCDRRDPCGNCQDAGISCRRERDTKRNSKSTCRQEYRNNSSPQSSRLQKIPEYQFDAKPADMCSNNSVEVMPVELFISCHAPDDFCDSRTRISYDPAYDAQMTLQHQLQHLQGLTVDRRRVLESALSVIGILSDDSREHIEGNQSNEQGGVLSRIPSTELLTWMLKDIESDRFGSFIADYFRHISKPTLKRMGLSLLHNKA